MFSKKCPWCENEILLFKLKAIRSTKTTAVLEMKRKAMECPSCKKSVTYGGRAMWWLLALFPNILLFPLQQLIGENGIDLLEFRYYFYGSGVLGVLLALSNSKLEKARDV